MTNLENAAVLRRWAMQCAAEADDPRATGDERERLLKMRTSLLELAGMQDWLDGERDRTSQQQKQQPQQHPAA